MNDILVLFLVVGGIAVFISAGIASAGLVKIWERWGNKEILKGVLQNDKREEESDV